MNRGLGWKPELPDHRDAKYALRSVGTIKAATLPLFVDLRPAMPPVVDQLQTSSCVGNAIAGMLDFLHPDADGATMMPSSRRFIYWQANVLEGTQGRDEGCYIRDGMKAAAAGVPHELACRFSEAKIATAPAKVAFTQAARRRKIGTYRSLDTIAQMQQCLADGFPFVGGVTVYPSFFSRDDGVIQMPGHERPEGGHAICFVGYDVASKRFIFRNSWGPDWAMAGHGTIPFAYLADRNLADDFWTARL